MLKSFSFCKVKAKIRDCFLAKFEVKNVSCLKFSLPWNSGHATKLVNHLKAVKSIPQCIFI